MTALSNSVILYFLLEESMLFISDKSPPRNGTPSLAPVDLKKDYVNVVELSLFELTLKMKDKVSKQFIITDSVGKDFVVFFFYKFLVSIKNEIVHDFNCCHI